ncbi:MAG: pitrilysin family protein [Bacillota bacterium]|nr:pitrilysin family protein [Bacillota bacterium]
MIKKDTLPNGMTVVTETIDYANSVSMGIWVKAGSRGETAPMAGISHFLEHMNFKGTERRSAKDLAESLECRGGSLNAYTTKEYTSYYCQVVGEDFKLALDVLSDLYLHSQFREEDIAKEKNVVLEEINLYEDSPEDLVVDMLNEVFWGDHPLARPILGYEDTVNDFSAKDLFRYRRDSYLPQNTILAVAGKLEHEAVMEEAAKLFADFKHDALAVVELVPKCHRGEISSEKDIVQEHICLGYPGVSIFHPDYYPLILANEALGGGASSRLFQRIREEMALSYSVFSFITAYRDCGMVSVYAGTSKGKGKLVRDLCLEEIENLRRDGISQEELDKLKGQIGGGMRIGLDSIGSRLNRLGRNELYHGRSVPIEEVVTAINGVTNEDIVRVARKYLTEEQSAYAFLGGTHE